MKSIKSRLEITLIGAALLPALVIAIYVFFSTQSTLKNLSIENTHRQIELLSNSIEATLAHVPGDLFYLRDANSMHHFGRALVINDAKALQLHGRSIARDFLSLAKNRGIYNQIRFIGADGKERIRIEHNEAQGNSRILQPEQLRNQANDPYFNEAARLAFGEYAVSRIDLSREDGAIEQPWRPTLRFATPIFAVGERLVGVLMLNVDANRFLTLVEQANQTDQLHLALTNLDGSLVASPDSQLNWGSRYDLDHGNGLKTLLPEFANQILNSHTRQTYQSADTLITSQPVRVIPGSDRWLGFLVAYAPTSVALRLLDHHMWVFAALLLITLVLSILLARYLAKSLTAPLLKLTKAADRLSKGDMNAAINIDTNDEIQSLAEAFERLRESVKLLMKLG